MQICSLLNYTAENSMFMFCKESYKHILCARLTFGAKPQLAEKNLKCQISNKDFLPEQNVNYWKFITLS